MNMPLRLFKSTMMCELWLVQEYDFALLFIVGTVQTGAKLFLGQKYIKQALLQ